MSSLIALKVAHIKWYNAIETGLERYIIFLTSAIVPLVSLDVNLTLSIHEYDEELGKVET